MTATKVKNTSSDEVRRKMVEFCLREFSQHLNCSPAYISALTSAAHICDQVSAEATRRADKEAAKACGDFLWTIADACKAAKRSKEVAE